MRKNRSIMGQLNLLRKKAYVIAYVISLLKSSVQSEAEDHGRMSIGNCYSAMLTPVKARFSLAKMPIAKFSINH